MHEFLQKKPLARAEMLCQEFLELLVKGDTIQALVFARSVLGPLLKVSAAGVSFFLSSSSFLPFFPRLPFCPLPAPESLR